MNLQTIPPVSGLILAGGRGRRLGATATLRDKGLQPLAGRPIVSYVIERLAPQVAELIISANGHIGDYASLGQVAFKDTRVVGDTFGSGPLAGLYSGLQASRRELLVTVPCDAPSLPFDLVARLWAALDLAGAQIAVATTNERVQPVFALVRRSTLPHLTAYLKGDGRKAHAWYAGLNAVNVPFDDEADAFANLNTPEDFSAFARNEEAKSP